MNHKITVFKSINGTVPQYLFDLVVANSTKPKYNLRNTATDLKIPKKNSSTGQKGFSYRGSGLFNSLPDQSKRAANLMQERSLGKFLQGWLSKFLTKKTSLKPNVVTKKAFLSDQSKRAADLILGRS